MWISKRKWFDLNKKVADLEQTVKNQQQVLALHLKKSSEETEEIRSIFEGVKMAIAQECSNIKQG